MTLCDERKVPLFRSKAECCRTCAMPERTPCLMRLVALWDGPRCPFWQSSHQSRQGVLL